MLQIISMSNNIIKGQVIPINQANIDTDSIIPKQYLKAITKTGFGPFLFDSWRYKDPGDLSTKNERRINENNRNEKLFISSS